MKKFLNCVLIFTFLVSFSGCASTTNGANHTAVERVYWEEEPQIEIGQRNILFDAIGNLTGIIAKIILWNIKIENHNISEETVDLVKKHIEDHPKKMEATKVRINQFDPGGEFGRLVDNKKMKWWWRVIPGIPVTMFSLLGRVIGGDHYNPYTDTVNVFSDVQCVAAHELGHAVDFEQVKYPGIYAIARIIPFVTLYQEYKASEHAFDYFRETKDRENELSSYRVLYPAFGTYVGGITGYTLASFGGAVIGHVVAIKPRKDKEKEFAAEDQAASVVK